MEQKKLKNFIRTITIVIFSSLIYSISMNAFVDAGNLFPGGFSGICLLITRGLSTFMGINVSFSVLYFSLNILVTILVFKYVGKMFITYSILWFTCTSIFTSILPIYPLTQDQLLITVFGGILSGLGMAIALRNNASSGGVDFIAIYASSRFNVSTWNYVFIFNSFILLIAGVLFGWTQALYSIIFQFCSTQMINELHTRYKLKNLFIITSTPDEVCEAIFRNTRHGITKMRAEGAYSHSPRCFLFMTINAYQVNEVVDSILLADPKAFINVANSERIVGNYYQKPLD
jgi:uncharacterized membrane-anchored protein YitT (DUF2179 family)